MKRQFWLIGIAAVAVMLLIGLLTVVSKDKTCLKSFEVADVRIVEVPSGEVDLGRELRKARRALARLQPSQPYIVIDTHANYAYLRTADSVLYKAPCSTGSGGELVDTTKGKRWVFNTPRGRFKV
ncbi:L,D-transpeptidase, partial [bacterium]|nr:L,D-transpeptidase [bacterium]